MPLVNQQAIVQSTYISRDPVQESLKSLRACKELYDQGSVDEACNLIFQMAFTPFKNEAIDYVFPGVVAKRTDQISLFLNEINDPLIRENCENYACYKLKQLKRSDLIKQIQQNTQSDKIDTLAKRLISSS